MGSIWEVKYEYEYMYEYYPEVIICPSQEKLSIKGKSLNVQQVGGGGITSPNPTSKKAPTQDVIESQIDGEFEGWQGETIVKLLNGQIWQQSEYYYTYHYSFMPKAGEFRNQKYNKGYMEFSEETAIKIISELESLQKSKEKYDIQLNHLSNQLKSEQAKVFLTQGVMRRIGTIHQCAKNIFSTLKGLLKKAL